MGKGIEGSPMNEEKRQGDRNCYQSDEHHSHEHHSHDRNKDHTHQHEHHQHGKCNYTEPSGNEKNDRLKITSLLQDEAVVISAECHITADRTLIGRRLEMKLEELAGDIKKKEGIIGHIKASMEIQDVEMYSVTDSRVDKKKSYLSKITIHFASITFFMDRQEMLRMVNELFKMLESN